MEMNLRNVGTSTILDLSGRFDAHNASNVAGALEKAISVTTGKTIINLKEVNFMDSTALAILVKGLKHCRESGGDLRLCNLQPTVRIIFELTRLDKAFEIYSSETEALA